MKVEAVVLVAAGSVAALLVGAGLGYVLVHTFAWVAAWL